MSAAAPKRSRGSAINNDGSDRDTRKTSAASGAAKMPAIDGDNVIGDGEMPEPVVQQRKRKQKNKDGTEVAGFMISLH
jgi:hypothetical protein